MSPSPTSRPVSLSPDQVRLLRVRAQRLDQRAPKSSGVAGVVKELCGVQAQDTWAFPLAIRARSSGLVALDVEAALVRERSVVRTWAMRGTLHLIAAEDLGWLLALLGPPFAAADRRRREQLGLDEAASDRGVGVIRDALAEHGPLTRAEIAKHLAAHGLPSTGQAPVHLIALTALQGLICLGPDRNKKPTYVLLSDWLSGWTTPGTSGSVLNREQALTELARRYLAAHGPATVEDYAAWSGMPLSEARTAWKELGGEMLDVELAGGGEHGLKGVTLQMLRIRAARLEAVTAATRGSSPVRMVPSFDPYLLGYRTRDLAVAPEYAGRIHPGGGVLHPAVLVEGRAAGTWRVRRVGSRLEVKVEPFGDFPGELLSGLQTEIADIGRFFGVSASHSIRL